MNKNLITLTSFYVGTFVNPILLTLFLPAVTLISVNFDISPHSFQWFITLLNLNLSLSVFVFTGVNHLLGRKIGIILSNILNLIGLSLMVMFDDFSVWLIAGCFLGLGIGSASLTTRMMLADTFSGIHYQQRISLFTTTLMVILASSPLFGGILLLYFHWPWVIFIMLILAASNLALTLIVEETKKFETNMIKINILYKKILVCLFKKPYLKYGLIALLCNVCINSWLVMSCVVLIHHYNFTPQAFGTMMILTNLLPSVLAMSNAWFSVKFGYQLMLKFSWTAALIFAGMLLIFNLWIFNIPLQIAFVSGIILCTTLILANAITGITLAIPESEKNNIPSVLGFYTLIYSLGGVIGAIIASVLIETDLSYFAIIVMTTMLFSWIIDKVLYNDGSKV